jgi:hypothetical protein
MPVERYGCLLMLMHRKRDRAKSATIVLCLSLALGLVASNARAGDDAPASAPAKDNIVKQAFKVFGFATDPGPPQDFVVQTRPPADADYVPVGRKAFVRDIKPKTPDQLKAMQADFDAVKAAHDALRANFPPAAQAVAAAEAAKAAKAGQPKKPPPKPAAPE